MNHPWRRVGLAAFVLVLGLLATDVLRRVPDRPRRVPFPPGPPAFVQPVAGLGKLEIAQRGPLVLEVEAPREADAPAGPRVRLLRVEGRDPEPSGEGGMLLQDVVLHRFAPDGAAVSTTRAPSAWIPLQSNSAELRVDLAREWRLDHPEIVLSPAAGARRVYLDAREVFLDPSTGGARAPGPFTARSSGLVVSSTDLVADPGGDLHWSGDVVWSFPAGGAGAYRGESDGGGELTRVAPREDLLRLPAQTVARILLPPESGFPGTLETAGLELRLARTDEASPPRPLEVLGTAPTRFHGPATDVEGAGTEAHWDAETGLLRGLELGGPLHFVHRPEGGDVVSGSATGRAVYVLPGETPLLEGGVVLETPDGTLTCQRLESEPDGGWLLTGPVLLQPGEGPIQKLEAPRVIHRPGEETLFEDGFVLTGADEDGSWTVRGRWLVARVRSADEPPLMEARGDVVWRRGQAIFRGERLIRRGDAETRLEGTPATGAVPLEEPAGALVHLEARRFLLLGRDLVLRQEPVLRVPAAVLELPEGQDVEVRASTMRWLGADRVWELTRSVRLAGGLEGEARRGTWQPDTGLVLEGPRDPAWIAGSRPDGTAFRLAGRTLRVEGRTVTVEERASASFHRPDEEEPWVVEAAHIVLEAAGGRADGSVRVHGAGTSGSADSMHWEGGEGGAPPHMVLEGDARLEGEAGTASGDRLSYDPAASILEAWGEPATVLLGEGRTARGRHLRLDLRYRLLAGEDLVIENDGGRR